MAVTTYSPRWRLDEFLLAWETGAFDRRVELVDGEVLAVSIGDWHGETTMMLPQVLPKGRFRITASSLLAGDSLPDPDCWVRRADAEPVAVLSAQLMRWSPADVPLVVEVSDETVDHDLGRKEAIYAGADYPCYWVVTRDRVYEHTEPTDAGYRLRRLYRPGERIPVPYADGETLAVDDMIEPV